jgi:hypothetical protein
VKIDRIERHGKRVRRLFMLVEVTYRDRPREEKPVENYYEDDELASRAAGWMENAMEDRDDSPRVRFIGIPTILDPDVQSIAQGDYPNHAHEEF